MLRIAISGYGRIGRCMVRAFHERNLNDRIEIVAINDLADFDVLTHLTRHDSTHGYFTVPVKRDGDVMHVGDSEIRLCSEAAPEKLPWRSLGVDIAVECSGKLKKRADCARHLEAGAGKVLASHPVPDADRTVVYGVNHEGITAEHRVISNASCTTNCLAPLVMVLDQAFGVEQGQMTTIHSYTNDQNLIDKAHKDIYRARSATLSMIPTRTGAAQAVGLVLPHLAGKLDGMAVRVPTPNVSLVDLHCLLRTAADVETLHAALDEAAAGPLKDILTVNREPLVSWDFNHQPWSSIVDATQTRVMGHQAKLMSWYDNEWGFSNRMLDVLLAMA